MQEMTPEILRQVLKGKPIPIENYKVKRQKRAPINDGLSLNACPRELSQSLDSLMHSAGDGRLEFPDISVPDFSSNLDQLFR